MFKLFFDVIIVF